MQEEKYAPPVTRSACLIEWANEYLGYVQKKHAPKTINCKRYAFKGLFASGIDHSMGCDQLTPHEAQKALQTQEQRRTGNAANKDLKHLKAAWNWGIKYLNLPERNPFNRVDKFASTRHDRNVPTLDDFWKVYHSVERDQDKLLLYSFLQTGARMGELFRLRWEDVDFFGKRIRLKSRKNRIAEWKSDWISIEDYLAAWLLRFFKSSKCEQYDFVFSFTRMGRMAYTSRAKFMRSACENAGVTPFGYHGIRHLFASILADKNVPLVDIQKMCRHSSILTTQKYIHWLKTDNREALAALPSLDKSTSKVHQEENRQLSVVSK